MKKIFIGMLVFVMLFVSLFAGAGVAERRPVSVVTTIFPIYDWAREIVGDSENVEITMLLDNGVDLHSYQPTVADIMKTAECDVFIYVGGESDEWVDDVLAEAVNPDMIVISLVEAMGEDIKAEEIVEGMEHDHDHDEDHDEDHDHDHEHGEESDEHVWLSLRNAQKLVDVIAGALAQADPEGAEVYQANALAYNDELAALDAQYAEAVGRASYDTLLYGDRFPFRYMVDDYGLNYYAAFSGCSAESEASFGTVMFLVEKLDELGLPAVLTIEGGDHRLAETIVANSQAPETKVLTMDSMQSVTADGVSNGITYLGVMSDNLEVLRQALNW